MKAWLIRKFKQWKGAFPKQVDDRLIDVRCSFAAPQNLTLGKWVYIGPDVFIECKGGVEIGDGVIISSRVAVLSSSHSYMSGDTIPYGGKDQLKKVVIGKAVWIGFNVTILPGVTIGDGAIIAACSAVTKSVAPGKIVGGNPAKELREREGESWKALIEQERYYIKQKLGR